MHSLLRRWLHKYHGPTHPHSSICTDVRERIEVVGIPTKYISEELAGEYAKYWAKIQEDNGEGLEEIQRNALNRWHAFWLVFEEKIEQPSIPLDFFIEVFDDYFFLGSLSPYIKVKLADETPANSTWAGLTTRKRQCVLSGPPEIQIELKALPIQSLTQELIQDFLDTLLHEMSHAFLMIYSTPLGLPGSWRFPRIVETEGLTGHGPCWVKVAAAIEVEAHRSLGGSWDKWDLEITGSWYLEEEALREHRI